MRHNIIDAKFKKFVVLCSLIICLCCTLSIQAAEHHADTPDLQNTEESVPPAETAGSSLQAATDSNILTILTSSLCLILFLYILYQHSQRINNNAASIKPRPENVISTADTVKTPAISNPNPAANSDNLPPVLPDYFAAAFNADYNGIIITDPAGKAIHINQAAVTVLDRQPEDIVGHHIADLMQLFEIETLLMLEHPVITTLSQNQQITLAEPCIYITDTGENKYLLMRTEPIITNSKLQGTILIIKELTAEYHLKEQLNKANKLENIGKNSGEIAHNFNNLLSGIMGFADLICINSKNSNITNYARNIIDTSEKAAKLSARLLTFSRNKNTTTKCIDVHRCIRQALTILSSKFSGKITQKTELTAINHRIIGDSTLIQSCIINIGINTCDAVQDDTQGIFYIKTKEQYLDPQYCDNSIFPIAPGKYLSIIINDYYSQIPDTLIAETFHSSFTDTIPEYDSYRGLTKIFRKITAHNGAIEINHTTSRGTEFTLLLPLYQPDQLPTQEAPQTFNIKTRNILLVDDQPISRSLGQSILNEAGYNVLIAENGEQALKTYLEKGHIIDLIIMDLVMPIIGGLEATAHLLEMNPEVKIIIASGMGRSTAVDDLILEGKVKFFISKPFTNSSLLKTIRDIL